MYYSAMLTRNLITHDYDLVLTRPDVAQQTIRNIPTRVAGQLIFDAHLRCIAGGLYSGIIEQADLDRYDLKEQ